MDNWKEIREEYNSDLRSKTHDFTFKERLEEFGLPRLEKMCIEEGRGMDVLAVIFKHIRSLYRDSGNRLFSVSTEDRTRSLKF